jgi:hypothetical protein
VNLEFRVGHTILRIVDSTIILSNPVASAGDYQNYQPPPPAPAAAAAAAAAPVARPLTREGPSPLTVDASCPATRQMVRNQTFLGTISYVLGHFSLNMYVIVGSVCGK